MGGEQEPHPLIYSNYMRRGLKIVPFAYCDAQEVIRRSYSKHTHTQTIHNGQLDINTLIAMKGHTMKWKTLVNR